MKKLVIISIGLIGLMASCNQAEVDRLEAENAASTNLHGEKNNKINHLLEELNYVADNLQSIREKQGIYSSLAIDGAGNVEFSDTPEDKVKSELETIDFLMTNNLDRIASLEKQLEDSGSEMNQVKKLLGSFKSEVSLKGEEIQELRESIVEMEGEYADLMDEHMNGQIFMELQQKQIELRDNELNTVYFVYGTKTELMENNIIQKKGGVLGVGSVNIVKNDFNKDYFTKVDLRQLDNIPVAGKEIDFLTEHPGSTYEIIKDDKDLISEVRIKNKDEFWAGSHYLVMLTK